MLQREKSGQKWKKGQSGEENLGRGRGKETGSPKTGVLSGTHPWHDVILGRIIHRTRWIVSFYLWPPYWFFTVLLYLLIFFFFKRSTTPNRHARNERNRHAHHRSSSRRVLWEKIARRKSRKPFVVTPFENECQPQGIQPRRPWISNRREGVKLFALVR